MRDEGENETKDACYTNSSLFIANQAVANGFLVICCAVTVELEVVAGAPPAR